MIESELRRRYVAACTERFADVRLFIRNVGTIRMDDGRVFRSGVAGMADVWGWLFRRPHPVPLEIELKNVRTPHTAEQRAWAAYCERVGVPYLLLRARDEEDVVTRFVEETGRWLTQLRAR